MAILAFYYTTFYTAPIGELNNRTKHSTVTVGIPLDLAQKQDPNYLDLQEPEQEALTRKVAEELLDEWRKIIDVNLESNIELIANLSAIYESDRPVKEPSYHIKEKAPVWES